MEMGKRKNNIELLRILAMFLIITFHYVYKSGYVMESFGISSILVKTFYFFGELGVNLFIFITGYFMVQSKYKLKKVIYLILEVYFYYFICYFIAIKLGLSFFQFRNLFPIFSNYYWFASAYILLYFLSFYLNICISHMDKRTYQNLLFLLLMIFSFIPTILGFFKNTTEGFFYYSRFIWFVILYLIGAYIRIYGIKILEKKKTRGIIIFVTFFFMVLSIFLLSFFKPFFASIGTTEEAYFWTPNNILMLLLSICIFLSFLHLKIKDNKWIFCIASTTFGIYLIHDGILQGYIWQTIFHSSTSIHSKWFILYILFSSALVFVVGAFIDFIRQFIFKYTVCKVMESKIVYKIEKKIKNVYFQLLDKV